MKTIQVTFEDEVHSRAKAAAHIAKITIGDLVRAAVEAHIRRLEGERSDETRGGK